MASRCTGRGDYSMIKDGATLIFENRAGERVGATELTDSTLVQNGIGCIYQWSALVGSAPAYRIVLVNVAEWKKIDPNDYDGSIDLDLDAADGSPESTTKPHGGKPKPKPTRKPKPEPDSFYTPPGWRNGQDVNCDDFPTHAKAQEFFEATGGSRTRDRYGLDSDNDGIACEG